MSLHRNTPNMMRIMCLLENNIMRFLGKAIGTIIVAACSIIIIALCLAAVVGVLFGLGQLFDLFWMGF